MIFAVENTPADLIQVRLHERLQDLVEVFVVASDHPLPLLSGKKPFACFSNRSGNGLLLFLRSLPVVSSTRFAKRSLTSLFARGGAKQGSGLTGLTSTL